MPTNEIDNLPMMSPDYQGRFGVVEASNPDFDITNAGSASLGYRKQWVTSVELINSRDVEVIWTCSPSSNLTSVIGIDTRTWLDEAFGELSGIDEEADAEGFDSLCPGVIRTVERLLMLIHSEFPGLEQPAIYPTEEGDIEIAFGKANASGTVLIVCRRDESAACFSHIVGKNNRARYDDCHDLPDAFVREQLLKLIMV